MNEILLIHHRLPYPLNNGMDRIRYNLILVLAKRYKITLAVPVDENTQAEWIEVIRKTVNRLVVVPVQKKEGNIKKNKLAYFHRFLKLLFFRVPYYSYENYHDAFKDRMVDLIKESTFDFVQILSDFSACYLKYISKDQYKIVGPIDDTMESIRGNYPYSTNISKKIGIYLLHRSLKHYYRFFCRRSDKVFFHSKQDEARVKKVLSFDFSSDILPVAPENMETAEDPNEDIESNTIIFVGGMGAPFNKEAALHLGNKIFPMIQEKVPGVKLYIVGNDPPQSIKALGNTENIIITGKVDNVRPYIRNAAVYVSTVKIGTGIKTKIIEALSMSKAIVATPESLQGLWEVNDSILISSEDRCLADHVVMLLNDDTMRKDFEQRSKKLYNKAYAVSKVEALTMEVYDKLSIKEEKYPE
jgi:polysaccharide biosynthesis protein PslH